MEKNPAIRVRFAPSPTGTLHVGGARTALFNVLFARATGGTFILRIEDTDRNRYSPEALESLLVDLKWMGLDWDEGYGKNGEFGPYQQSDRLDIYKEKIWELVEKGNAYPCFCTSERLTQLREEQSANKTKIGYDGHCRNLNLKEAKARIEAGEPYVIRLKVPEKGSTVFEDSIRGEIETSHAILDDMVLFKQDGYPTYHLASVIDDHLMKISHVLRGDEWISSTPKHVLIYNAFGWIPPKFVHLPVILAPGGGKLSKRKGAASVGDYKEAGFLPEALYNFLALLGWNPGDDREILSAEELAECFSIERIHPKSAAFDEKKLEWINQQYIQKSSPEELQKIMREAYKTAKISLDDQPEERIAKVAELLRDRAKRTGDFVTLGHYFFHEFESYDEKAQKKGWKAEAPKMVEAMIERFEKIDVWTEENIGKAFMNAVEELDFKLGKLVHPIRLAVSGMGIGPGLFELIEVIGKDRVLNRLEKALKILPNP